MWSTISTFIKDDKSAKYKIACCVFAAIVYVVTLYVPYATLLNYIMTYCGYSGAIVFIVCAVRYFSIRSSDRKSGKVTEDVIAIEGFTLKKVQGGEWASQCVYALRRFLISYAQKYT